MLKQIFLTELSHFRQLSDIAQRLMMSIAVYAFSFPLLYMFVNAFILRRTNDFSAVAIYNLGVYVALPFAFYLNGLMLRTFPIRLPYLLGMVGQGIVACLVFFFSFSMYLEIFLFGLLYGLPMGLYWSNRNFLSLDVTQDENRVYFTGIELVLSTTASIVTPLVVGWTISVGEWYHLYSTDFAYRALGLLSVVILLWGGLQLANVKFHQPGPKSLRVTHASPLWRYAQVAEIFRGFQSGIFLFFTPLLVFTFFGKEATLGTLQSMASIIGAFVVYTLARWIRPNRRLQTLQYSIIVLVLLSSFFVLSFTQVSALVFLLFVSTLFQIQWMTSNPITMKVIDEEENGDPTNNYAYVCNREVFLNIGRASGVLLFLAIAWWQSQLLALRLVPLFSAFLQIGMVWAVAKLEKKA